MSEQDPTDRLAELMNEQLKLTRESRRAFIHRVGANPNTTYDFLNGKRRPRDTTLRPLAEGLGWDWEKVVAALQSSDPASVELADVQADPWGDTETPPAKVSDLTDEQLLVELTRRLAERNATIERIRGDQGDAPVARPDFGKRPPVEAPPVDVAADQDRSGVGRHLQALTDGAGEESQDPDGA